MPKQQDAQKDIYYVEKILSHRTCADGSKIYYVKWIGYDQETWEPSYNLNSELIKSYKTGRPLDPDTGKVSLAALEGEGPAPKSGDRAAQKRPLADASLQNDSIFTVGSPNETFSPPKKKHSADADEGNSPDSDLSFHAIFKKPTLPPPKKTPHLALASASKLKSPVSAAVTPVKKSGPGGSRRANTEPRGMGIAPARLSTTPSRKVPLTTAVTKVQSRRRIARIVQAAKPPVRQDPPVVFKRDPTLEKLRLECEKKKERIIALAQKAKQAQQVVEKMQQKQLDMHITKKYAPKIKEMETEFVRLVRKEQLLRVKKEKLRAMKEKLAANEKYTKDLEKQINAAVRSARNYWQAIERGNGSVKKPSAPKGKRLSTVF